MGSKKVHFGICIYTCVYLLLKFGIWMGSKFPDSITLVGQRWQWAAGRRRFVTVGPPVAH